MNGKRARIGDYDPFGALGNIYDDESIPEGCFDELMETHEKENVIPATGNSFQKDESTTTTPCPEGILNSITSHSLLLTQLFA
jgi:hypothetical protein